MSRLCCRIHMYSQPPHKRTVCFGLVGSYGAKIPATTRGLEWGVLQRLRPRSKMVHLSLQTLPGYDFSLAMISDLFVLPELCSQSLSTFYCRFHCRPLNHFGLSVSRQTRKLWPWRVRNTNKDEMNCSIKVWPLV